MIPVAWVKEKLYYSTRYHNLKGSLGLFLEALNGTIYNKRGHVLWLWSNSYPVYHHNQSCIKFDWCFNTFPNCLGFTSVVSSCTLWSMLFHMILTWNEPVKFVKEFMWNSNESSLQMKLMRIEASHEICGNQALHKFHVVHVRWILYKYLDNFYVKFLWL